MPYLTKINAYPQKALRFYDGLYRISKNEDHAGALDGLRIVEADLVTRLKRADDAEFYRLQGACLLLEELFKAVDESGQTAEKYYHQIRGERK